MRTIRVQLLIAACLVVGALASGAAGQVASEAQARLPVRVIGERLVLRCELSTRFRRIPVNLFLDYDRPCGLELHNRAADGIEVDRDGGVPITIHLPGFNVIVERREHGDEDLLNDFTKLYSRELGEVACVGTIGATLLARYHVVLDVRAGFVFLEPPHQKTGEPPTESPGEVVTSLTMVNGFVWMPVKLADERVMQVALGTSRYDTVVDESICFARNRPAGDLGPVALGSFDLSRYAAFRPEELIQVHPDGALGTTGLNLLEHLRIEVDRENRWLRIRETAAPEFPEADLAYFRARVEDQPDALVRYLESWPGSRLSREAARLLLDMRLDESASADDFQLALDWMDRTRIEDLRATEALATLDALVAAGRPDVAVRAGEIGIKSGRKDRYAESVHRLHARVGGLLLEADRGNEAWEHLLSAAFGLPEDGHVNLDLGRFYERQARFKRAMSRYVQAVITPETGALAVAGLERVQRAVGGERLSVDLVDKMVSGKVDNFAAATKFAPDETTGTNRVVLAELFTNAHFGRPLTEGWVSFAVGGAMAVEGLISHFPRDRVAVLTHQGALPEPTALMNAFSAARAASYGAEEPVVMIIDGRRRGPGAGRRRDIEAVYDANRQLVLEELARPSEFEIALTATVQDGVVEGEVEVTGPSDREGLLVEVVLAERGVLYPGKAKVVVHRMVARGSLTEPAAGVAWSTTDGVMVVPFARSLAEITTTNETWLTEYEARHGGNATRLSTAIDPRQVSVLAWLRDVDTLEILQAAQLATVPLAEDDR